MIIKTKAPVRMSFGSCGDTDYFLDLIGWGNTVSASLELYSYCELHKRDDSKIVLRSLETGHILEFNSLDEINLEKRELNIAKAIVKHYGNTGVEVVTYTDIPLESGMGGSAAHAVAMIRAFDQMNGIKRNEEEAARLAYHVERDLAGVEGGYQDQWASSCGGFNYMLFQKGGIVKLNPMPLRDGDLEFLEDKILLVYVPRERHGRDIHKEQKERREQSVALLKIKRDIVEQIKDAFLQRKFSELGKLMHMDWNIKKQLSQNISNPRTDEIYEAAIRAGALGGRFFGAGGGGCAIFYTNGKKEKVMQQLEALGAREVSFRFERPKSFHIDLKSKIDDKVKDHHSIIIDIMNSSDVKNKIELVTKRIIESYRNNGKVIIFGNGGSAADAQHIAGELVNKMNLDRPMLNCIALNVNTSVLTAIANDTSYENVFARQVENMATHNDVVIGISTSGKADNVMAGLRKAKEMGATVVYFTGRTGGRTGQLCKDVIDISLNMPSDYTPRIQEAHILAGHIICELVEEEMYGNSQ